MKNLIMSPGRWLGVVFTLMAVSFLFSACSKSNNDFDAPPTAGLMAFNLAADKPAIGFTLSGTQLGSTPLTYTSYTGTYRPIYVGQREVRSFDYNTGNTIATSTETFQDSSYYSAFLVGINGNYRNVVVKDDYTNVLPASGKAWVRYINAVADTAARPSISVGELTETAVFGSVSEFVQVNAGDLSTSIDNGTNFSANRTIAVEENKIYTILFVGQPGQTDPALAVQVKFILNGTATN